MSSSSMPNPSSSDSSRIYAAKMAQAKIARELARRRFHRFIDYANPEYTWALHHVVMAAKLQALAEGGSFNRLYIGMPPRHGKSEQTSVWFPAWLLGINPRWKIIHASYASSLSNDFSRRVRAIVRDSLKFRTLFPHVRLDPENQSVTDWKTTQGGGFRSIGVGGGVSGHGADWLLLDDPLKEGDAESLVVLESIYQWYATAARLRLMPGARVLLTMTRWHPQDLAGRLLALAAEEPEADQWETLVFQGTAGMDDPLGRQPGAALWPERYDEAALKSIRKISERNYDALFQQNPRATIGKMFEAAKFKRVPRKRSGGSWVGRGGFGAEWRGAWVFDLALSEKEQADYTCWARVWYQPETHQLAFDHISRRRYEWPKAKRWIKRLLRVSSLPFVFPTQLIELMAMQELRSELPECAPQIVGVDMPGDKRSRAQPFADRVEAGDVFVEQGGAGDLFVNEHDLFPGGQHDDLVDVSSVATHYFGLHQQFEMTILAVEKKRPDFGSLIARLGG